MRPKLFASEMSRAMTCDSPWIRASSSARTPSRMTYTLVAVAAARAAPTTSVSSGASPAWLRRSQASASPTEQALAWLRLSHARSEEHTSELQSHSDIVCRLLLEKKKKNNNQQI